MEDSLEHLVFLQARLGWCLTCTICQDAAEGPVYVLCESSNGSCAVLLL
jgi:hypothetical protein